MRGSSYRGKPCWASLSLSKLMAKVGIVGLVGNVGIIGDRRIKPIR